MIETLTPEGYEQTKIKLRNLEERLSVIERRTDLSPDHLDGVRRSYRVFMQKLLREIAVYEAKLKRTKRAELLSS